MDEQVTLIPQLISEIQELFSNRTDSFNKTIVKEAYKPLPKNTYPRVEVQEIDNSEVTSRSTAEGERTTALGYQITCYSRDTIEFDNMDSARFMCSLIRKYIDSNYNMNRLGQNPIIPMLDDNTVMYGVLRYSCVYDKETNLIYKN